MVLFFVISEDESEEIQRIKCSLAHGNARAN